ncbi:HAD family hydrolase [Actinomadura atramentaria]|uniref:HAD family hydrolase n=1 Tax=Actinomadura atramentaria TaxID=1990 RepID=UPI00037D7E37|nr:HAD family phosphatase [Actinomadura atramentaria]
MSSQHPFGAWTPKAVVFDCDGLLVDTEPCWTVAETELFARRGFPFGAEQKALVIGKSMADVAVAIAEYTRHGGDPAELELELRTLVTEAVRAKAAAMPGAADVAALVAGLVPVAVASNSPRALLETALACGGLDGLFAVSLAADDVERPKPAPDLYLAACRRLGAAPADTLAFEDSMTGLRSARAAGLRTVGVPTLDHEEFPADFTVASLHDPALLAWIETWGDR